MAYYRFNQSITSSDVNGVLEANLQTLLYKYLQDWVTHPRPPSFICFGVTEIK